MPSCDGSNCGACDCECTVKKVYPKEANEEIIRLKRIIRKLEKELREKQDLERIINEVAKRSKK
jgi:hypothetical protein